MDMKTPNDFNTSTTTTLSYTIPGLDIQNAPFIFTLISQFLGIITPYDLPLDLVRDAIHSNLTLIDFATKSLKIESGFIVIMTILVIMSFVPLCGTIAWCCRNRSEDELYRNDEPINPLMLIDDSLENSIHCRRRASIFILFLLYFLLIICDIGLFITNSQLSKAIEMTPDIIEASIYDTKVFLKNTHVQIKYQLDNGLDHAIDNVTKDLHDIDILLGEPIKHEIAASTGLELAFDSLQSISMANSELITRIQLLQESIGKALKISQEAAARMEELQIQLSVLQRQCTFRDRPLCDTLRIRSFEENGIIDALKSLQEDQNIFRMKYLGELESGTQVQNLSNEVAISRSLFGNYPTQLKSDTILQRNETLDQLNNIKHKTTANAHLLTHTITSLLDELTGTWEAIEPHYKEFKSWQELYWTLTWAIALLIIWIVAFMSLTFCCFLCNSNVKAAVIMVTCVIIVCFGSFVLMLYGVFTMALGGNTEIFLCQPLFDEQNHYEFLGKLFDKPGYIYEIEQESGIIARLLKPPDQNKTFVNVNLATAIKECEQNKPSFNVFQLDAFVDTDSSPTLTKQYENVNKAINSIRVSEKTLLSLTQTIQTILENMLHTSDLNSTVYRANIAQPTPEKDLATFIDQMQRVALQIQDVATSARMTTLGSRAKRLQASILQPLELLRNEILYHLTALELQRDPWQRQVNQTLIHLRNIQGYLDITATEICQNQTKYYIKRLKSYLSFDKGTVSYSSLGEKTALCRPLFDIFDANRNFLCRNAVDYINGIWISTFLCLLCWSIGTPLALNIISLHRKLAAINQVRGSNAHLDGNRTVTWRSGDANNSPRTSPRTSPRMPRTPRTPIRRSPKQPQQQRGTKRSKPLPKRPIVRQITLESLSVRSLPGQDDESIDNNRRESEMNEPQSLTESRGMRDYRRDSSDEMDNRSPTPPIQDQSQVATTTRKTFQDIRRELEAEQNINEPHSNETRTTFRDVRREIQSNEQFNEPAQQTIGRTYRDLRKEIETEHQQQRQYHHHHHHDHQQQQQQQQQQQEREQQQASDQNTSTMKQNRPTYHDLRRELESESGINQNRTYRDFRRMDSEQQQEQQQQQTNDQNNNRSQQARRTYRDLRREIENESSMNQNQTFRDARRGESIDSDQNNNENTVSGPHKARTFRDLRREIESEQQQQQQKQFRDIPRRNYGDRDRDNDRDRNREYRATRLPPAPPAPPPPIPPPDYMNINRTRAESLYSNRISSWGLQSPSRNNHRDPRPPVPPAPPPAPYMNRQDSVRSVRWETTEDISFEDVDADNPTNMGENNMV